MIISIILRSIDYSAHVYDVMRAQLPTLELDAVFEAKEELALAVKQALADTMTVSCSTASDKFPLTTLATHCD